MRDYVHATLREAIAATPRHALRGLMLDHVGVDKAGRCGTVSVARDSYPA
jgi:hypothetical protein